MLAAVLFDMDGTLVDTEGLWWDAVAEVAASVGRAIGDSDAGDIVGRPVAHTAEFLSTTSEGRASVEALRASLHNAFAVRVESRIVPLPGVLDLLDALAAAQVPAAIVSASPREIVDLVRVALGAHRFAVTVAVEDTPRTKPAPDPYLAAAAALGVDPRDCVVVEDTLVGVEAAQAAGCIVVAVGALPDAPGRTVLDSLETVTPERLAALTSGRRQHSP